MNRNVKALVMMLVLPTALAFSTVATCAFLGISVNHASLYERSSHYVFGVIVGWWLWGVR